MQMKIVRAKHGEVVIDTGSRDLSSWFGAGSSVAHVAEEIMTNQLHLGSFRVEVQASDSTGRTSALSSVNFEVE